MGDGLREGGRQVEGAHLSNCKVWILETAVLLGLTHC